MATIYEVSKLAGVSLATVSRVINDSDLVSPRTRKKVEVAMQELGYQPNSIAQSLASRRTNSVGVLVPMFYGPFYGEMLSGIEEELRKESKQVVITSGHSEEASERSAIDFLLSRRCDALILQIDALSNEYLLELGHGPVPFVLLDRFIPELPERCICLDNELGGYLAARAVTVLGHEQIAYISGPLWKEDATARLEGHKRALQESGIEFDPELLFEGNFQESGGYQGMKKLLRTGKSFSVVVCANDEMAAGALGIIREQEINVPDEMSVMGFDNVFFARYFRPKLSTVEFPVREMGQMAARYIMREVYGKEDAVIKNLFKPEVVMRSSVSCRTGPRS
jgi:LacI family transcriptional regulator